MYYVEVLPHEATQLHQHDHDCIYVSLGPSDVVNAILAKPEVHLQLNDGETHFTRGGFVYVARNLADTWRANYRSHFTLVMYCGWKHGKSRRLSRQERTSQLGFY